MGVETAPLSSFTTKEAVYAPEEAYLCVAVPTKVV